MQKIMDPLYHILIVINPNAGRKRSNDIIKFADKIFDKANYNVQTLYTRQHTLSKDLQAMLLKRKWDTVIAVGGDGTINEVAGNLVDSLIPLGIVPTGSGNGLARHFLIPMDLGNALQLVKQGRTIWMDVGYVFPVKTITDTERINARPFISIAGIGFDALVAKRFDAVAGRGLINYLRCIMQVWFQYKPIKIEYYSDQEEHSLTAFSISFANGSQYGYGARIAPHGNVQDGLMNVITLISITWYNAPYVAWLLLRGKIHRFSGITNTTAKCNRWLILYSVWTKDQMQFSDICKKCLNTFSEEEIEDLKQYLINKKLGVRV